MIPPIKISITTDQLIGLLNFISLNDDRATVINMKPELKSIYSVIQPVNDRLHGFAARWQVLDAEKRLKAKPGKCKKINHSIPLKYHEAYTLSKMIEFRFKHSDSNDQPYEHNAALMVQLQIDKEL